MSAPRKKIPSVPPDWVLEILEIVDPLQEEVAQLTEHQQGLRLDFTVLAQQVGAALSSAHARALELERRIEQIERPDTDV